MASSKGGHDCEFVDPPPASLECSICLLTLRDPHVISCCGNHFCHSCISRIQGDGKPCPLCNESCFTTLLHKGVLREVNSLTVHCRWKQLGCDWEGELRQLEAHLNLGAGLRREGCGYVLVECTYKCGEMIERCHVREHEMETCPRRPVEVQLSSLTRRLEEKLTANERKLDTVIAENKAIKDENKALKLEMNQLREKHESLERELDTRIVPASMPPVYFSVMNYEHYKSVDYWWISPPFYSHPGGYKMICYVYPNGYDAAKDTHLSFYVGILHGEYDDKLKWPFNGVVTVEMYNWLTNKWEYTKAIELDDSAPVTNRQQAVDVLGTPGWGKSTWISSEKLKENYLRNGVIRFKITKIELK